MTDLDFMTREELIAECIAMKILDEDDLAMIDSIETWQLTTWINEEAEDLAAQDHYASFYSY